MSEAIAILGALTCVFGLYKDDVRNPSRKWVVMYLTGFFIMCVGIGLYAYGI